MGNLSARLTDFAPLRVVMRACFMLGDSVRPVIQKPIVKDFIGYGRAEHALDAGSGRGLYTRILLHRANHVTALDFDPAHINALRRRLGHLPQLSLQVGSADKLPFPDQSFDLITHCEVLEHIHDDRKVVSELYRVLKPGGRLILSVPVPPAPFPDGAHVREGYTFQEISDLLTKQGFQLKRHRYCMFKYSKTVMKIDRWWGMHMKFPLPTIFLLPVVWERFFVRGDASSVPYDVVIESVKPS